MRVEQGGIIQVLEAGVVGRLGIWRNVVDRIKHVAEVGIHSHRLEERLLGSGRLDGHHHGEGKPVSSQRLWAVVSFLSHESRVEQQHTSPIRLGLRPGQAQRANLGDKKATCDTRVKE